MLSTSSLLTLSRLLALTLASPNPPRALPPPPPPPLTHPGQISAAAAAISSYIDALPTNGPLASVFNEIDAGDPATASSLEDLISSVFAAVHLGATPDPGFVAAFLKDSI